jgi:hypothetical protein
MNQPLRTNPVYRLQPLCRLATMAACLLLASGCSVCQQARRTMLDEPAQYSSKKDREQTLTTYRMWAEAVWRQEQVACSPSSASTEYGLGFRDGFVDYVYAGGTGEPPPVPPRMFWNVAWRTPEGHAAANEWFAGYRHGARVARDGGYRRQAVVPSTLLSHAAPGLPPADVMYMAPPLIGPEDLGPPPEPTGAELEAPAPQDIIPEPTLPTPAESADELPAPAPAELDRRAAAFSSALRSAAHRGGVRFVTPASGDADAARHHRVSGADQSSTLDVRP